jgi:lysozyme family protein
MFEKLIARILQREGGSAATNDGADSGGRTQYGISERAHPAAWADGVVTLAEATHIYYDKYVLKEKFQRISDPWLREQVVDFGVTSGPDTACRLLQRTVGVTVDGNLGALTLAAIDRFPSTHLCGLFIPPRVAVNLAFAKARADYYVRIAAARPKDVKWLRGWLLRAVGCLTIKEPT